jgi:hypothetical protein
LLVVFQYSKRCWVTFEPLLKFENKISYQDSPLFKALEKAGITDMEASLLSPIKSSTDSNIEMTLPEHSLTKS